MDPTLRPTPRKNTIQTVLDHHEPHQRTVERPGTIFHQLAQKTKTKVQERFEPTKTLAKDDDSVC